MQFKWLQQAKFAFCVLFFTIQSEGVCNAQIVPDATLPTQSTVQMQDNTQLIQGGTRAGNNLFHSFREFSVPINSTAFFNNSADVQNILTRVTGSARSDINGIIKANGFANLFLINPNGIIFGSNARLDIGGSFIGSTASAIGFGSLGNFSATNPLAPSPLLTINPSALLFSQIQRSSIESNSVASDGRNPSDAFEARGLRVDDGKSLLLVGGDVSVNGGGLYAFGGRVELGGLAGVGTVGLNGDGGNFSLSFPDGIQRSDISLSNDATVNVRAGNGGSIGVNADNLDMTGESRLFAGIESGLGSDNSKAGNIDINATGTISLQQRSFIFNDVQQNALGQGGDVNIRTDTLRLATGSQMSANTSSTGQGGNLTVDATSKIELIGGDSVDTLSGLFVQQDTKDATGNAGILTINTPLLQVLNRATVNTNTSGAGRGGELKIDAGRIEVIGTSRDGSASSITAQANSTATGKAGNLTIKTDQLLARDGGQVSASTFGAGPGGDLNVNANKIEVIGTSRDGSASSITAQANSTATGKAGNLTISTGELLARDGGQVSTSTFGASAGGDLKIDTTSKIELIGVNAINTNPSGLFAQQGTEDATGNARSLIINTPLLRVLDGANVSAGTSGVGTGGDLKIDAGRIEVIGTSSDGSGSKIVTQANSTATGKAGDLTIKTDELLLQNGGQVSAGTFGAGNGGNLKIDATSKIELLGVNTVDNNFSSSLFVQQNTKDATGNAGSLTINTPVLRVLDGAEISASTFGVGRGGDLRIDAGRIEVIGTSSDGYGSKIVAQANSNAMGAAGNLTIRTGELLARDGGQVSASTFAAGEGGDLKIDATSKIELIGVNAINTNPSGLFAQQGTEDATGNAGSLTINTPLLQVLDGANVRVSTSGLGTGGDLKILTDHLIVRDGGQVSASTFGAGKGGDLTVNASEKVEVIGTSADGQSSSLETDTYGTGKGGNLTIDTRRLVVKDAQVSASTSDKGDAGTLAVKASQSIDLSGVIFDTDNVYPAGLFAQANSDDTGRGGTLKIETGRLSISNGARAQVATFGAANAGDLFIRASEIDVFETPRARYPNFAAAISGGVLTTRETTKPPQGNGGNVNIFTNRLTVRDGGRVTMTTEGEGNAGRLQIHATDSVEVFGITPGALYRDASEPPNSEISAAVAPKSTGNGGSLKIDTGKLIIRDSGTVTVRNEGKGGTSQAGNSEINARSINLDKGTITATTNSGNGGDIILTLKDLLLLRNKSTISTTAGTAQQGGNGGNITINAPSGFIVSAPNENSNIAANAFSGSGGRVTINATGIYGLTVFSREDLVRLLKTDDLTKINFQQFPSSITAISQTSPTLNGQVNLNTPDVDVNRGLVQLPTEVVDAERLINQNFCAVTAGTHSSFTVTGRGGIADSPDNPAVSDFSWEDWRLLEVSKQQQRSVTVRNTPVLNTSSPASNQIIEAQGWVIDFDGSVILMPAYPVSLSQNNVLSQCHF